MQLLATVLSKKFSPARSVLGAGLEAQIHVSRNDVPGMKFGRRRCALRPVHLHPVRRRPVDGANASITASVAARVPEPAQIGGDGAGRQDGRHRSLDGIRLVLQLQAVTQQEAADRIVPTGLARS